MSKLFTKSFFEGIASKHVAPISSWIVESKRSGSLNDAQFDIFLSHSFLDRKVVEGIYATLTDLGFVVYVDWIVDSDLNRADITKATVDRIRMRMKKSNALVYAISNQASHSRWMPWELGFMDARTNKNCFILPVAETHSENFKGQDFLLAYDRIEDSEASSIAQRLGLKREGDERIRSFSESISYTGSRKYKL